MREDHFELTRDDGVALFVYQWLPDAGELRGVVQIAHGMAEHAGRYARVARVLAEAGFAVVADDHRGHGRSVQSEADLGHLADRDGFAAVVEDLRAIRARIATEWPAAPVVLFGHSMGAMLTQAYLLKHAASLRGAVLSGASHQPAVLAAIGRLVAQAERLRVGPRRPSSVLQAVSFGGFNRGFEGRTEFDWLSRDTSEVDAYVADPRCGFAFTTQAWLDVFDGIRLIGDRSAMRAIPHELPVLVLAGAEDPVGHRARGPKWVVDAYRAAGLTRVTDTFYPGARHEILNETNRDEVQRDLLAWLDGVMPPRAVATD